METGTKQLRANRNTQFTDKVAPRFQVPPVPAAIHPMSANSRNTRKACLSSVPLPRRSPAKAGLFPPVKLLGFRSSESSFQAIPACSTGYTPPILHTGFRVPNPTLDSAAARRKCHNINVGRAESRQVAPGRNGRGARLELLLDCLESRNGQTFSRSTLRFVAN